MPTKSISKSTAGYQKFVVFGVLPCLLVLLTCFFTYPIRAASLTAMTDTLSRLKISEASNHTIKFTSPTGAGDTTDTITVTFPAGFTIGTADYTDIDLSYGASTGAETSATLAATPSATDWGAAFSSQVLTLTHPSDDSAGDITAGDKVILKIGLNASSGDQQITNPSTADSYTLLLGGTFGDAGTIAISILDDDQVQVDASINPTLTFDVTNNSTSFGIMDPGIVATASPNVGLSIATNAYNGYSITVRDKGNDTSPGLYKSSVPTDLIGSSDSSYADNIDLTVADLGYGIQATCTAGCTTATDVATRYQQSGTNVGGLELTDETLATYSSELELTHTMQIVMKAKASGYSQNGTYTDTLTFVAFANF